MKYTLLELTQNILSSLDSDEVNSVSDTAESRQVAQVIRTAYFNVVARANPPESKKLFQLQSSAEDTTPVLMTRPDNVSRIEWIKYNKMTEEDQDEYQYVTILPLQQFLDFVHQLDTLAINVETFSLNSTTFAFQNDKYPDYCTVVDDYYVVFDSYDIEEDTVLQSSKSLCYGQTLPDFELVDNFTPELDDQQFPLLLNEAKSLAFFELKQMPHEKAEQEAKRQWRTLQRTKKLEKMQDFNALPSFGRK